jgi:two-component system, NarL family, nitrate/nitrite response regulator NarL
MASDVRDEPLPRAARIRALLVSEVRLYREGVEAALGRRDPIDIVGTASTIGDAIDRLATLDPAVIVVDVGSRDSLAGIRALAAAAPQRKIVAFAVDEHACDIPSYAEAGIAGYVPCDASIDDLAAAIASVTREEAFCSPRVAGALFRRLALRSSTLSAAPASPLSQREREILTLIRNGLSNKDIARQLTIEVATVKNHVHSVLTKLQVSTRAEAAALGRSAPPRPRVDPD